MSEQLRGNRYGAQQVYYLKLSSCQWLHNFLTSYPSRFKGELKGQILSSLFNDSQDLTY